jgi:hypothetical protein
MARCILHALLDETNRRAYLLIRATVCKDVLPLHDLMDEGGYFPAERGS